MSSYNQPNVMAFTAYTAVERGDAVKLYASDYKKVQKCTANTDPAIGIALCAASAGGAVEVALPGGGAVARAGEAITGGKLLVPGADGEVFQTNASSDRIIAVAMDDAVENDLVEVLVVLGLATAADK